MVKATGRGATGNRTSTRFHLPERETDGDWLDAQALVDGAPPSLKTSVTVITPRTIITRNTSPDVPFSQSINAYAGCEQPHTVTCEFEAALSLSNTDEFFDQNRAGAIAKVSLCALLSTYATIEPDAKFTPHWFSLFPVGHSPSLRVKLLAALPKAFDRGSILNGNELTIFRAATIEPTVLEIREPIANQELPLTVSHTLMSDTGFGPRNGSCHNEREDRPHADSLSVPSTSAMVFAW